MGSIVVQCTSPQVESTARVGCKSWASQCPWMKTSLLAHSSADQMRVDFKKPAEDFSAGFLYFARVKSILLDIIDTMLAIATPQLIL